MSQVVVHIGTGKTGTSYLQSTFKQNLRTLADAGWTYPQYLPRQSHVDIAIAMLDTPAEVHVPVIPELRTQRAREDHLKWLGEKFSNDVTPESNWIVSSENFQGALLTPALVSKCSAWFGQWFDDVTFLCYFRRQDFMIPALYAETAKSWVPGGELGELDWSFVVRMRPWLAYHRSVALWSGACGQAQYVARPYLERWKADGAELMTDFLTSMRMPPVGDWQRTVGSEPNAAMSAEGIEFLRWIRPDLEARVLAAESISQDSVGSDQVGRALASFVAIRDSQTYFDAGKFNNAVAAATPGAPLRMRPELADQVAATFQPVNEILAGDVHSQGQWSEWIAQPAAATNEDSVEALPQRRIEDVLRALSAPQTANKISPARRVRRRLARLRRRTRQPPA